MLIDLALNLIRRVRHEDPGRRVACAHLRLRALQRWEELAVQEHRLGVLELLRNIARQPEVRVLIDRTGNEAGDVGGCSEDLGEGVGEGGRGLDGGEVDFAYIVAMFDRLA